MALKQPIENYGWKWLTGNFGQYNFDKYAQAIACIDQAIAPESPAFLGVYEKRSEAANQLSEAVGTLIEVHLLSRQRLQTDISGSGREQTLAIYQDFGATALKGLKIMEASDPVKASLVQLKYGVRPCMNVSLLAGPGDLVHRFGYDNIKNYAKWQSYQVKYDGVRLPPGSTIRVGQDVSLAGAMRLLQLPAALRAKHSVQQIETATEAVIAIKMTLDERYRTHFYHGKSSRAHRYRLPSAYEAEGKAVKRNAGDLDLLFQNGVKTLEAIDPVETNRFLDGLGLDLRVKVPAARSAPGQPKNWLSFLFRGAPSQEQPAQS